MTYPLDLPGLPVREPAVLPGLGLPRRSGHFTATGDRARCRPHRGCSRIPESFTEAVEILGPEWGPEPCLPKYCAPTADLFDISYSSSEDLRGVSRRLSNFREVAIR